MTVLRKRAVIALVCTAIAVCFMATPFVPRFPQGDLPAWSSMFVALCFSVFATVLARRTTGRLLRRFQVIPAFIAAFAAFELVGGFIMAFGDRYMRGPR